MGSKEGSESVYLWYGILMYARYLLGIRLPARRVHETRGEAFARY